jgi:SagB-type dehydrogenase family enzyme
MKRLRQDLNHLTSAMLLVAAVATGMTGLVADLWDLNDFWYHTLAGYVMGALAILHVALNWRTLLAYARFRLTRRASAPGRVPPPPRPEPARGAPAPSVDGQQVPLALAGRAVLSRRGLLGASIGAAGGWVIGRGLRQPPPIPAGSDVGVIYHEWSKPGVVDALGSVANWGQVPPLYKEYPGARLVSLPEPDLSGGLSTSDAIVSRRSTRTFAPQPLALPELSRVLQLAAGISADRWGNARRTAPSSGALYPVEVYPVVHNVEGLERGVYHYAYRQHGLELIRPGDLRQRVVDQGLMQEFLGQCGAVVFLTQILGRMRPKYQDRSYRYGLVEVGHVGQNLYLAATSMGLGACGVGAFMDDDINAMLGVDGTEEAAIYLVAIGHVPSVA